MIAIIPERLAARMEALGLSQTAVANAIGVKPPSISRLVKGKHAQTRHIFALARAVRTTPEYLTGVSDDPDADAPAAPLERPYQAIMMQVLLPAEDALARMFEALLAMTDPAASTEEQARSLARNLPVGLSQLRDLLPSSIPVSRAAPKQAPSKTLVEPR